MFCSKNVGCLLGVATVACYILRSFGLNVLCSEFILNYMPRLNKEQRVWICLEHVRFQHRRNLKENGPGNNPASTKLTISTATYPKFFKK